MKGKVFLLLTIFFLNPFLDPLSAQTVVENESARYSNKNDYKYFIDEQGSTEFSEINAIGFDAKFKYPKRNIPNYGILDKPVWLKFHVQNNTSQNLFLEIKNPDIDSITVYKIDELGEPICIDYYGDLVSGKSRKIKDPYFYIDLKISKGEQFHYLIRFRSEASGMFFPLSIGTIQAFFEEDSRSTLFHGIYFGLILFIFIYHSFLFLILRRYEYLFFALFVGSVGGLFAITNGFVFQYFTSNWLWLDQFVEIFGALGGIFIIAFTSGFLKTRINTPVRHIWLLAFAGIYVLSIILSLYGAKSIALEFIHYNTLFTLIFLTIVAITSLNIGFKPAKYYLFSLSFFVVGFIIYLLTDRGVISINAFTTYSLQIGVTISIILMAFALGKKINIFIDKRDEARALAIKTNLQNERLIAHHHQLLEARVTERTKDLEHSIHTLLKQREELKDANLFKDKVFSVISHDLKSPLSTLGGLLNVLKMDNIDKNEKGKILANVELALKNTRDLLDNILIWATRKHKTEITDVPFDLNETVEDVFSLFRLQAEAKSIRLINSTPDNFTISTDENMLRLVLRNLISNAIKFTDKKGFVEIRIKNMNPDIQITVQDNGLGMTEEDQMKLFNNQQPFTTRGTHNEKGTGLGLLLCKEFIEKSGGEISVRSKKKEGTSFIIKLKNVIKTFPSTLQR